MYIVTLILTAIIKWTSWIYVVVVVFFSARELLFYTLHSNTHNVTFVTTGRSLNLWVVGHLKDNNKKTNKFTYYLGKKGITFKSNKQRPLFFVPRDSGDEGLRVNASHLLNTNQLNKVGF